MHKIKLSSKKLKYISLMTLLILIASGFVIKKYSYRFNIGTKKVPADITNENTIILRVTDHEDQADSQFCWVFSTLTIIESMYLEKNPSIDGDDIKLSPWYFRESTGSDKLEGTIINAFDFHSKKLGLVSRSDYNRSDSGEVLKTTFLEESISPKDLRKKLVGDKEFWAYAISSNLSGWHASPDPDAIPGTKAFFIPRKNINSIIRKSLLQKVAVGFWFDTHVVVIYGAEYDANNIATKYYIKDSYSPYFYEKSADWVHQNIIVLTAPANLQ